VNIAYDAIFADGREETWESREVLPSKLGHVIDSTCGQSAVFQYLYPPGTFNE